MVKKLETNFKRIEKKYIVDKEDLDRLLEDLREYLVEDDFPNSSITNIYFDTEDFQVIRDSIAKKNEREKIRMRTYATDPKPSSQVFLELKKKDAQGIGHKFRLATNLGDIQIFMGNGDTVHVPSENKQLVDELSQLRDKYQGLDARMYIFYNRFSLKEKHTIKKQPQTKIRITIDQNLTYRDYDVDILSGVYGNKLVGEGKVVMEIKTPGEQPLWLKTILEKHGIEPKSFSKYGTAYRKSQGILQ